MESVCDNCINAECVWRAPTGGLDPPVMFCPQKKVEPMTNYGLLVSKTPEELAEWVCIMVCNGRSCDICPMYDWCATGRGILDWLKAPVEVDNGKTDI